MNRPNILITNDDGIAAPGIKHLIDAVSLLGNICVVAPNKPQSGMGHAVTFHSPLRKYKTTLFKSYKNVCQEYMFSGTPVDCVKFAIEKIMCAKPDICLSGINHGANHSINVLYSGTISAAMEASIEGIPSIGFSLVNGSFEADFSESKKYVQKITKWVLNNVNNINAPFLLNVNIPEGKNIKGIKFCEQGLTSYKEQFVERKDPTGKLYYWLTGRINSKYASKESDIEALKNNYVSIVPTQYNLTDYNHLNTFKHTIF